MAVEERLVWWILTAVVVFEEAFNGVVASGLTTCMIGVGVGGLDFDPGDGSSYSLPVYDAQNVKCIDFASHRRLCQVPANGTETIKSHI